METPATIQMVLITGMSGSGKSVALHALEDAGYYCVDNLPPELLLPFVELERSHHANRLAIAVDVRSATSLPLLPHQLIALRAQGVAVQPLFLDASTDTLSGEESTVNAAAASAGGSDENGAVPPLYALSEA